LLQSGVAYVGGYQGAPVSHLIDVMVQAEDYMGELGVHVEACSNEASPLLPMRCRIFPRRVSSAAR
jgi:indolepyruvate ferredoxin oxidoreductase, alpha subunit